MLEIGLSGHFFRLPAAPGSYEVCLEVTSPDCDEARTYCKQMMDKENFEGMEADHRETFCKKIEILAPETCPDFSG